MEESDFEALLNSKKTEFEKEERDREELKAKEDRWNLRHSKAMQI